MFEEFPLLLRRNGPKRRMNTSKRKETLAGIVVHRPTVHDRKVKSSRNHQSAKHVIFVFHDVCVTKVKCMYLALCAGY